MGTQNVIYAIFFFLALIWSIVEFRRKKRIALAWTLMILALLILGLDLWMMWEQYLISHNLAATLFGIDYD